MALDIEELIVHPFEELIQRGKETLANAEVAEKERYLSAQPMLRSARAVIREGERALQKVRPLLKSQLEKHGDAFIDTIRRKDAIFESQRHLEDLLYDIDDFIDLHSFSADKFSELQAASKAYALSAIENIRRFRVDDVNQIRPASPAALATHAEPPAGPAAALAALTAPASPTSVFPPLPPLPPVRTDSIPRPPTRSDSIDNQAWNGVRPKLSPPHRRTASNSTRRGQDEAAVVHRTSMLRSQSQARSINSSHSPSSSFNSRHSSKPSYSGSLPPARPGHQWFTISADNGTAKIGPPRPSSSDVVGPETERVNIMAEPKFPTHIEVTPSSGPTPTVPWTTAWVTAQHDSIPEHTSTSHMKSDTSESSHVKSDALESSRLNRFMFDSSSDSSSLYESSSPASVGNDTATFPDHTSDLKNIPSVPALSIRKPNNNFRHGRTFDPSQIPDFGLSHSAPDEHETSVEYGAELLLADEVMNAENEDLKAKRSLGMITSPKSESALRSNATIQENKTFHLERPARSESALGIRTEMQGGISFLPGRPPRSKTAFRPERPPRPESALRSTSVIQDGVAYTPWKSTQKALRSHSAIQEGREFQWRPPRPEISNGEETASLVETMPAKEVTLQPKTPHKPAENIKPTTPEWYSREENCSIGQDSTLIKMHGFCEGAHLFKASGLQESTKTIVLLESAITTYQDTWGAAALALGSNQHVAVGTKKVISQCIDCEYRHPSIDIKLDLCRDSKSNLQDEGVFFRLRFLFKSHLSTDSVLVSRYGCLFCSHMGHTSREGDATVFTSQAQLFRHLSRHPRPLPMVPGITVLYGNLEVDDPAVNNYDVYFPNPPMDILSFMSEEEVSMLSRLPAARALKSHIQKEGEKAVTDPDGHRNILQFLVGARIVGVEFPERWSGKWCMGWHDGVHGAFPAKLIALEPPARSDVRLPGTNNDGVVVTSRWKWETKDLGAGWLTFDKNTTISNVSWLNQDSWCWSGTTKDGKSGLFPSSHIKPHSIRDPGSILATRLTKSSRGVSLFSRRQSTSFSSSS